MRHQIARERRCASGSCLVALALFASLTAACGARWTDDQRAAHLARQQAGASAPAGATDGEVAGATTGGDGGTTGGSSTGSEPVNGADGGGPAAGPGATGPRPCDQASDAPGVSDSQIAIGSISSRTGPVPGLGETAAAAARAYVAFRNAGGGVCGRELVLREADDGTDNGGYRRALQQLAPTVLGIAGGIALGDVAGADLVEKFGIPIVNATSVSSASRWVFDVNPDYPPDLVIGKYKYLYAQGARTVAMAYLSVEATRREAGVQRGLMEAAGLKVVDENELPLTTLSYDAAARRAANSGANYLWTLFDTQGYASMARAVADTGYNWLHKDFSYQTYGTDFIDLAGAAAAEGVTAWLRSVPTEENTSNKAMGVFVEWMNQVAPGVSQDILAIDSWVSLRIFLEALEGLPGPISRDGLVQQVTSMGRYDAEGMFAPIDVGRELAEGCLVGVVVRDGRWQRQAPDGDGFLC